MRGDPGHAFVVGELLVRATRHLVVVTLPLVCWLAGQECPAQALLAWGLQRAAALLTTRRTAAGAVENIDISPLPEGALEKINRIQAGAEAESSSDSRYTGTRSEKEWNGSQAAARAVHARRPNPYGPFRALCVPNTAEAKHSGRLIRACTTIAMPEA